MTRNRFTRQTVQLHPDPRFGRMLLASLGLHLAVVLFFSFALPQRRLDRGPVYVVDLVNLPVADPRAGRPDAGPPAPKPVPETIKPVKPEVAKIAKPEPVKPVVPVKKPATTKVKPVEKAPDYETETLSAIEKLRRKRDVEELKEKLAGLSKSDTRPASGNQAPLGMPGGKGTEAGVDEQTWIKTYLKENWNLSKYQVPRRDLETKVLLAYDAKGLLANYKILTPSGNTNFDDSIQRTILKSKQLPFQPKRRLEIEVVFNLKELLE